MKIKGGKQPFADLFLRIFEALGFGHVGKKLLRQDILMMFSIVGDHMIPVWFDNDSEHPDSKRMVKNVQDLLKKVKFLEDKLTPHISINTFFTLFQYIAMIGIDEDIKDEDLRGVIEKANGIFVTEWSNATKALINVVFGALIISNDFRKALYSFDFDTTRCARMRCSFQVVLHKVNPEVREFMLDGTVRNTHRVGRCGKGSVVKWCCYSFHGREYPIYIQNHAIDALEKRIDTSKTSLLLFHLVCSLEKPELRFYEGKYLLTYRISSEKKVGYFVCTFVSDCIVLRTFLFITYDGTPEGDLINIKLELDRQSKTYMGLEKHSTYEVALHDEDLKEHLPSLNPARKQSAGKTLQGTM